MHRDPDQIVARLAAARLTPVGQRGDHDLNPTARIPDRPLTAAAVLVPLVTRAEGITVLLTQRTAHLQDHAGQISFPGGRLEESDADAVAGALRETWEEIGLAATQIRVVGQLDTYITGTGYRITPVVGLVTPPLSLTLDAFEVAEAFEVPLAFILDPAHHERHSREWQGQTRHFYVLPYQNRYIWGATAGMLVNLVHQLRSAP